MANEIEGKLAWDTHHQITKNEEARRQLLFHNMFLIYQMHSKKLYQTILGDEDAPWSAYLGQHDVFYSVSKVYTLDKIYKKFVIDLGMKPEEWYDIPFSKLFALIKIVNKRNVSEWLDKARELTTQDFEDELRKISGKVSYLDCPHTNKVTYEICQSCGFRHKQSEESTQ